MTGTQAVAKTRRTYNQYVADETREDYALRFTALRARLSSNTVGQTALGATAFLACVPRADVPDDADLSVRLVTGPEVLAGSTRLKAGTATKLALNLISTLTMARLGKVHGNRMVDVRALANAKLVDRGTRLVAELTGLDREAAHAALLEADGRVPVAVVMQALGIDVERAAQRLAESGSLRRALEP